MLMDIKCSVVSSIKVDLKFDDGSSKERLIAIGDLVDITYNGNGLRRHVEGKVLAINANGTNPKEWYIIVDGSDDFKADKSRFSPTSILDCEIIRKAAMIDTIQSPVGEHCVPFLREVKGQLQYSKDGFVWHPINLRPRDIIEDQEGTVPDFDNRHHRTNHVDTEEYDDDEIIDANY